MTFELTRKKEKSLVITPICCLEAATHDSSLLAPDDTISISAAHKVFLEVH